MADGIEPTNKSSEWGRFKSWRNSFFTLRAADVQLYRLCDDLSGALIFPMIIFSPWAFGTTQPWSIWTMNIAGFALGFLLLLKLFIRETKGYPAPRWENFSAQSGTSSRRRHPEARFFIRTLAALTFLVLAYCLVAALNATAVFNSTSRLFEYYHYLAWLPHSLDAHRSWLFFWRYIGLAAAFWAIWNWLLGLTTDEERALRMGAEKNKMFLPIRLQRLLWVLCLNGAVLGIEGIIQRESNSPNLLFVMPTHENQAAVDQFGPYAYRSNAAQYFNLLWPLCLGFWWTLQRAGGLRTKAHHILLLCAMIMAACPLMSTSRGGALVAAGILALAIIYLTATALFTAGKQRENSRTRWGTIILLAIFSISALSLGWYFGWDSLAPRMEQIGEGYANREEIYDAARPMAADYPLFGTGPGTFATVFQLYRFSNTTYWPEQLHNDWLETRITFGWLGLGLLLAALICVLLRRFAPGGIRANRRFAVLLQLALAGCLVHARFDFPLQIHSVLFLFLIICAILFSLGRRSHSRH